MGAKINLRTGKIIGAEKGSFAWYHEKGHIAYDNSEIGISNGVRQNMALYCSLMFLALGKWFTLFQVLAICSVAYLIGLVIYEEAWCNIYASDMLDKKEDERRKNKKWNNWEKICDQKL